MICCYLANFKEQQLPSVYTMCTKCSKNESGHRAVIQFALLYVTTVSINSFAHKIGINKHIQTREQMNEQLLNYFLVGNLSLMTKTKQAIRNHKKN